MSGRSQIDLNTDCLLHSRSDESQHIIEICVGYMVPSTTVRTNEYTQDDSDPCYTRLEALTERSGSYDVQSDLRPAKQYRCSNDRQHTDQLA
jgi:hypothetical protein